MPRMQPNDYMQTQLKLIGLGNVLMSLDLAGFIESASIAEAAAPIVDPTLYKRGAESLVAIKEFAQAMNNAKAAFQRVQRIVAERIEREGMPVPPALTKGG